MNILGEFSLQTSFIEHMNFLKPKRVFSPSTTNYWTLIDKTCSPISYCSLFVKDILGEIRKGYSRS